MKVSNLISYVRSELTDDGKTRWTDDVLLSLTRRAFLRLNDLICRNAIELGKSLFEIETQVGVSSYDLPYDFSTPISLFDGTNELTRRTLEQFNSIEYALPCSNYIITNGQILITGTPIDVRTLRFYYFTRIYPDDITLTSDTPFDGRLDFVVLEYLTLRAKNINENTIDVDMQFLKDLETAALSTLATIDPVVVPNRGWIF